MEDIQRLKEEFTICCNSFRGSGQAALPEEERLMEKAHKLAMVWVPLTLKKCRKEDIEDAVQEACKNFLAVMREGKVLNRPLGYFSIMVRNAAIDIVRHRKIENLVDLATEPGEEDPMERQPSEPMDPLGELARKDSCQKITSLMAALSKDQRTSRPVGAIIKGLADLCKRLLPMLFSLHFDLGENLIAVAESLGMGHDALRKQKERCLTQLKKLWIAQFGEPLL